MKKKRRYDILLPFREYKWNKIRVVGNVNNGNFFKKSSKQLILVLKKKINKQLSKVIS